MVAILVQFYGIRRVSNINSAAICLILACALTIPAHATTIIVTNTNDNGSGSLRQALAVANNGDTIDATGISGAISLISGELLVNKSVTINGAGADVLAVDGNAAGRVFFITLGETVTISGFTIRNGHAGNAGGGIDNEDGSTVTVTNCTLSGNSAGLGGGMFNVGMLAITSSTLSNNSASLGGGVFNTETFQIGDTILNMGASGANIANFGTVTSLGYNLSSDNGGGVLTGPGDQINTNPLLGPLQNNGGRTFTHALLPGSPATAMPM